MKGSKMQGCGSGFNDFVDPDFGSMGKKNQLFNIFIAKR
jgi:hypothetical protein